ncbi:hypothetical protein CDL15_Pgr000889 [Punica granatum]|uniref:Secreted protein n=1 Tax=Punica granatum TaxID=22663 RepID=A0A218XIE5_PUNGR|nr:hypothetical protein CDL15_Pgr000889 [Punica granatum]PKI65821.1 hypothetical protein CRG98_013775 [Punica granatum]
MTKFVCLLMIASKSVLRVKAVPCIWTKPSQSPPESPATKTAKPRYPPENQVGFKRVLAPRGRNTGGSNIILLACLSTSSAQAGMQASNDP